MYRVSVSEEQTLLHLYFKDETVSRVLLLYGSKAVGPSVEQERTTEPYRPNEEVGVVSDRWSLSRGIPPCTN